MVSNGKEEWKSVMEKAEEMIEQGRKEMLKAADMAKDKGEDAWEEAQTQARQSWKHARARGAEFWDDAKDRGEKLAREARDYSEDFIEDLEKLVKKNPARSMGLTLLVGVVIGALLSRDRDS